MSAQQPVGKTDKFRGLIFDAFLFTVTVGIWGFIIAVDAMKWVMP